MGGITKISAPKGFHGETYWALPIGFEIGGGQRIGHGRVLAHEPIKLDRSQRKLDARVLALHLRESLTLLLLLQAVNPLSPQIQD